MEFEWKPSFCDICQKVGHKCSREKIKSIKQWKSKEKERKESDQVAQPIKEKKTLTKIVEQASTSWT